MKILIQKLTSSFILLICFSCGMFEKEEETFEFPLQDLMIYRFLRKFSIIT